MENGQGIKQENRTSTFLKILYAVFFITGILITGKIVRIQWFYKPDPYLLERFAPVDRKEVEEAVRGDILTSDGEVLATSVTLFQMGMDCSVRKAEYASDKKRETAWRDEAKQMCEGLAKIYPEKTAGQWYDEILAQRKAGKHYLRLGDPVDYDTRGKVSSLPLFNKGRYVGGLVEHKRNVRVYPYGSLARKAIGNANDSCGTSGLEFAFDEQLRGKDGEMWMKVTDAKGRIPNNDKTITRAENGLDVRTTLDLRLQDVTDRELRKALSGIDNSEGGCAVVMDVKTGAIKAMVNLHKEKNGRLSESYNYAVSQKGNPGSVFKAVTLMALLDDGKIRLEDSIPTFYGKWSYKDEELPDDEYLTKDKWPCPNITVSDGLMISSNHVFRYLACENYGDNPSKFTDKIKSYRILDKFDFDIDGLAKPTMHEPSDKKLWSVTSLPSIAMGYSVNITPLHTLMFYNAIANKGRLMKPYLVENIEKDGKVEKKFGGEMLDRICSKSVADTLTRALLKVTEGEKGTARIPFKDSRCRVAGKTGTSRVEFVDSTTMKVKAKDGYGRKKHQATFVGFFPAEDPQYTAIVVIYSKPMLGNVYGVRCAPVVRAIADDFYCLTPQPIKKEL